MGSHMGHVAAVLLLFALGVAVGVPVTVMALPRVSSPLLPAPATEPATAPATAPATEPATGPASAPAAFVWCS